MFGFPPDTRKERCDTCIFWNKKSAYIVPRDSEPEPEPTEQDDIDAVVGECRFNPPTVNIAIGKVRLQRVGGNLNDYDCTESLCSAVWPVTYASDNCSRHYKMPG